jgi:hypothetical protein
VDDGALDLGRVVEGAEFLLETLVEDERGALGGAVGYETRGADESGHAAHGHHVALLVGDHGREEFSDGVEVGDDVDVVKLLDLLGGDVEDGELAVGNTGVVDQDAG